MALLANKSDIETDLISEEAIRSFCENNNIAFYKHTSAKTGEGIK